jgi:hypothetical protein
MTLLCEGDVYSVDVYLMGHKNRFLTTKPTGDEYCLSGNLWTLVGEVASRIHVRIVDGVLLAVADTDKGMMKIEGRLSAAGTPPDKRLGGT